MQPYLRYALRGLIKRPGRALFSIFIITVGVMLLTGTTIVINGVPEVVRVSYEEAHMADFALNLRMVPEQIVNDTCSQEEGVSEFEIRLAFRSTAYLSRGWPKSAEILLFGVKNPLILNRVTLVQGRFFNGDDEEGIIVEHDYGENTLGKDVLVETPFGNVTLKVVGTCKAIWMPRWYISSTVYALVPLKTLQSLLKAQNLVNMVLVRVEDQSQVKAVMNNVTATLKPYGVISRSLEGRVVPIVEAEAYYGYLLRLIFLIGLSLFAVGLAMVYSTLSLSISQELREIGTLKTLGATRGKIVLTYLLRGALLGFFGSLFGVLLGVSVASLLMQGLVSASLTFEGLVSVSQSIMQALVNNQAILISHLLLGIGLSLILASPPAWTASRTPIAQAVKNFPGLSMVSGSVKKPWPSRGPLFLKYALRSLARRKGREAVVVSVIVISVGLNSTLVAASESQQAMLDELSGAINFDFLIYLSRPSNASVVQEALQKMSANISFSEVGYFTNVKVAGYTLAAIGSRIDTSVFNYFIVEGHWLQNDHEVIFPERLAREIGVKVGDELVLSTERANETARVVGLRRDPVVNALQIPLAIAQALDGVEEEVNGVAVKAKEGANLDRLAQEIQRRVPNYLWYMKKAGIIQILSDMLSKAFLSTASVMIVFTWITSLILIFSILGQDINEERSVIAIMKALGFTKRGCVLTILSKLLILGAFAAGLCVLFSPTLLTLFTLFLAKTMAFTVPIYFSQQILLNSLIFITATILPSGLILGYFAASIQIPKALRYE